MKLPDFPVPDINTMTTAQLKEEIDTGFADADAGRVMAFKSKND